jgi:hypothetical protein
VVSVEPPCARHAPQLTSHPWRAPRAPRARAYADGRRRCPCRRRAWRRARRGRPAAGAGGRARRGRPPVENKALSAGQPLPAQPVGRGWPTLGATPGTPSGAGQSCSSRLWPNLGSRCFPTGSTCAARLEEHDLGRVHDRVQPVGDGEHRALLEGLADGRLQHRVGVVVDGGLVKVGLRVRAFRASGSGSGSVRAGPHPHLDPGPNSKALKPLLVL